MTAKANTDLTFSEYCAIDRVNFSRLKAMAYSPAHYRVNYRRDTPALGIGRLIHMAVLEPEEFADSTIMWTGGMTSGKDPRPTTNKRSNAYKAFCIEANAAGKVVIDAADRELCLRVADAVHGHPAAHRHLSDGVAELTVEWTHPIGIECKSRLDYLGLSLVDLKSSADVRPSQFGKAAHRYNYHAQAAMYQDAAKALQGDPPPVVIIAVEKAPPFDVVPYVVPDEAIAAGRSLYQDWMVQLARCLETDSWPGMCPSEAELELPQWAFSEFDDATLVMPDGREVAV